ncbi:hypothetical protein CC1G_03423 [Coprinopsis cinerea okayama7|uniref:AB hydrolase-1 domain-containing protein n=1 Tax=Coprinopsis cinerea (strain Okayama-7 / 130 / ATCC MYA-4618 / FGSC 9003) TaxID=240176 RepID=A8NQP0_COPC7|nr:hypothetical protein CC1G_03423 [Coprinopsis cinerea okayama7\|eukprot:XP_001835641.1 hypothetical protein CC1G_03423 [Coprinopsis cinerea okayama7\
MYLTPTLEGIPTVEAYVSSSDGLQIYATAVGHNHLPSLVFVHGLACSALIWASLFQNKDLLKHFFLVAYDMRGHGRSGKPSTAEGHLSSLYADDFAAVVKEFKLNTPIFVGWSLGATVAADIFTHLGPDAISAIIYTAPVPYMYGSVVDEVSTDAVVALRPGLLSRNDTAAAFASRIAFVNSFLQEPDKVPTKTLWSWVGATIVIPPDVFQSILLREQDPSALLEAGRSGFPALLITGGKDQDIVGEKVKVVLKPDFPRLETFDIPEGGHAMFYEFEEEYVREIIRFASSVFRIRSRPVGKA